MASPTLLDIAKRNGNDEVVGLIEESILAVPEIAMGAARTIRGRQYKTNVRTAVPTVGFRNANEGVAAVLSTREQRLVETFIMNARFECDKAVADSAEDGPEAYIAEEKLGITKGAMRGLAKQFYYGYDATFGDAKGFPGLIHMVDSAMVLDATGTTDSVCSSVWGVKFGLQDVRWVYGQDGQLAMSENRLESIIDSGGSNRFTAYVSELLAYPGLQVGSIYSVGRIKKLTTDSGKGLTDDLLAEFLTKYPVGMRPDALLLSKRSLEQLRKSRTAVNATGAPAPTPTEFEGIPLVPSESIVNTETLTL